MHTVVWALYSIVYKDLLPWGPYTVVEGDTMSELETDADDVQTYNLEVDPDTVIDGLKINDRPGEQRNVLFHKDMHGDYGTGTLRDVRGLHWDGAAPIQLRPKQFVSEPIESPAEARSRARDIAEERGDDPEEAADAAMDVWEDHCRGRLQEEIVVEARFPEETTTIYTVEYVDE